MRGQLVFPAIAGLGLSAVSAQRSSSRVCSESEISIEGNGDLELIANCETVDGSLIFGSGVRGDAMLNGPSEITGDIIIAESNELKSLQSETLQSIGGTFRIRNATALTEVVMSNVERCKAIDFQSLPRLETLTFSTGGLNNVDSIVISDTFLDDLDSFDVSSVKTIDINNNRQLASWTSDLKSVSESLKISANGFGLDLSFPELVWIANMSISNASSVSVPNLQVVNGSLRLDSNSFETFSAPNLTRTKDGDLALVDNSELANVTFPSLERVAGGFLIANNTELQELDGFEKLQVVGGAIQLRGNFTKVRLPSLKDVKGAFDIASTEDIEDSCEEFQKLGVVQGKFSCRSKDSKANDVNSNGGDSDDDDGAASSTGISPVLCTVALLSLASTFL